MFVMKMLPLGLKTLQAKRVGKGIVVLCPACRFRNRFEAFDQGFMFLCAACGTPVQVAETLERTVIDELVEEIPSLKYDEDKA